MLVIDLRERAAADANTLGQLPTLTPEDREKAIDTWRGRMVNETISSRVFAAMLPQAMAANMPNEFLVKLTQAAGDELRHGQQCAAVVHALGGDPYAEVAALQTIPAHEDASPVEALLRNVLSISCLSETVAVALIGAERLRAGPPGIAATLSNILADEVRHASMGWTLVERLMPTLCPEMVERLNAYLTIALRHLVAHELAHLPASGPVSSAAVAVGVCDGGEGRLIFFDTVQTVIVPRLNSLGFDATSAWRRAQPRRDVCAA